MVEKVFERDRNESESINCIAVCSMTSIPGVRRKKDC